MRTSLFAVLFLCLSGQLLAQGKSYRLKSVDIKNRIIWGSECIIDDNLGLAFGGQDQLSPSGSPGTRVREAGEWKSISEELDKANVWREKADGLRPPIAVLRVFNSFERRTYLSDRARVAATLNDDDIAQRYGSTPPELEKTASELDSWLDVRITAMSEEMAERKRLASGQITIATGLLREVSSFTDTKRLPGDVRTTRQAIEHLEQAANILGSEPPPRALSPIAFDEKTRQFLLFGGDHLDYLTNDTWAFDPNTKSWKLLTPKLAPPPRANHKLVALGNGKFRLEGGYTYTSNTDYMGGQYKDIGDGPWTFDISTNEWSGGEGVSPQSRTYRTGKFDPNYYLEGPPPDRAAHAKKLAELPENLWVALNPPHLPEMNRDWGTAILDPDRDQILRFSGGHCAHSGSDVLHYHIETNRWELPFPVEFPLGQTYDNTEFPSGPNFNGRPWVTGHTYQNYGYDTNLKKMLFNGQTRESFIYDPDVADWTSHFAKPKGMDYGSCFFTLTCTPTPKGLVCWTNEGRLFAFENGQWKPRELSGEKLPGSSVDNSTIVYDNRRDRLLAVRKEYGDKHPFSGDLWAIDCKSFEVSRIRPKNEAAGVAVPYLCQLRYDPENDLLLVGGTLEPDASGLRRTPAYDCAANEWISLRIQGDDPSGEKGRNVSLGMMYDAKRKLFWAVDTKSRVFVLRLVKANADARSM